MSNSLLLGETLLKQNEILTELLDIITRQRDALKAGKHADLQVLMSELRHVSVRCQAIEAKRAKISAEMSGELGCADTVSEIVKALPADDEGREAVSSEGRKMIQTVEHLKIEMTIMNKLMEEAKALNEMLINEWQKLSLKSLGSGAMGTFDAKI